MPRGAAHPAREISFRRDSFSLSPLRKKERKRKRGEGEKSGKGDRGETLSSISGEEG